MLSASSTDSKSITVEYQLNQAPAATNPLRFGVYRSSDDRFDSTDVPIDLVTLVPPTAGSSGQAATLDQAGQPAAAVGTHQLTITLPQGLPPYPRKPYVLVVADPGSSSAAGDPRQTASLRTYVIGVVTHGGLEDTSWKHGPPWELQIAYIMRRQGYDAVIPYNWVAQSSTPGAAIRQSPRLARIIRRTAGRFPVSSPVDLQLVGHSEGTVVNTYAIVALEQEMPPQLKAGFITDTLLDPHAANNHAPGQQYSVSGTLLGGLADALISDYQGRAKDPPVFIPSVVDTAQVFYQHTTASKADGIYNLWGQVPVTVEGPGPAVHYYNLTAAGATHSGKTGVALWYRNFIAPTLGNQAPMLQELQLDGQIDHTTLPSSSTTTAWAHRITKARFGRIDRPAPTVTIQGHQPEFSGTAAPGSVVRLYVGPAARPSDIALAGWTTVDNSGHWSLSTRPLPKGQYRAVVTAFSRALHTRPGLTIVPTQPLGRFAVDALTNKASS
jgi:hypothetical protein